MRAAYAEHRSAHRLVPTSRAGRGLLEIDLGDVGIALEPILTRLVAGLDSDERAYIEPGRLVAGKAQECQTAT